MAARKYYVVKTGKKTGIFETWEECRESVEGYPGAEYKSFKTSGEAERYLGLAPERAERQPETGVQLETGVQPEAGMQPEPVQSEAVAQPETGGNMPGNSLAKPEERPAPGTLLAYVDGSYEDSLKKYAFGCVFILPEGNIYTKYGNGDREQALQHRNVTGEMLGAMYAVRTAMASGFRRVELRYDYEGIEKWVTGMWRARTELTGKYAGAMWEWGKSIEIVFTKVAAHSNVYYNELADKMAKTGLREGRGTPEIRSLYEEKHGTDEIE